MYEHLLIWVLVIAWAVEVLRNTLLGRAARAERHELMSRLQSRNLPEYVALHEKEKRKPGLSGYPVPFLTEPPGSGGSAESPGYYPEAVEAARKLVE